MKVNRYFRSKTDWQSFVGVASLAKIPLDIVVEVHIFVLGTSAIR